MAKTLYFNGLTELKNAHHDGRRMVGEPVDYTPVYIQGEGWKHNYLPANRIIHYKSSPSRHACDARCMNASGRTMNCECACGGKNHGKGRFACEAAS
jgi:hypothetical protein